ncbi:MAG: flagellar biogenesis protein FliO [Verrucomicrobiales bacterium]|jgi:flagellar biogenesis protein FliO
MSIFEIQQLLATVDPVDEEARKAVLTELLETGAKIGGILILVATFAWLRMRFIAGTRRLRGPREKPWEESIEKKLPPPRAD